MTNYTQKDYERDIKILEGAPEGASHSDSHGSYWKLDGKESWLFGGEVWLAITSDKEHLRSLSDINNLTSIYKRDFSEVKIEAIKEACDYAKDKCIDGGGYFGEDYESKFKQNGAFAFKGACLIYAKKLKEKLNKGGLRDD